MKKILTMDGNEAAARASYMFTEVAGIYPITPSSPMAEHIDEWSNKGEVNLFGDRVKVIEMQSEAGAAGLVHGSLKAGCLTSTYTSSQGLLLMIPNMYKIAGEMLPCVIHVAARSLATHALSIMGDHQDVYAARQTGFAMLASSSVQDAFNLSLVSHLSTIDSKIPFMHFFDGFRTSHELQKIEVLEKEDIKDLVNYDMVSEFRSRSMNSSSVFTSGTAQNDDIYFQATEVRNEYYNKVPDVVNGYMENINSIMETNYKPFNYYGVSNPKKVIIAMGSVCETIKETIDVLIKNKYEVGLIEVHLYRPFSVKHLLNVLPESVKSIAVLDRTKEHGSVGEPLYLDVVAALKEKDITIVGGRYGLSSKNTDPAQIKAVYDMLDNPINNFTIGINDDVTHTSLEVEALFKTNNSREYLIYGYGSDGMVSASKSIIKLVGDNTDNYVQGYFQYDSKKSGGITKTHLRFSDEKIRSTYYVDHPELIAVTKDSYLENFDCYSNLSYGGTFVLNTIKTGEELNNYLPNKFKKFILENNINFYIINAHSLAIKCGLGNKISTVMQSAILYLANMLDYNFAKDKMKEYAYKRYFKKGNAVIEANYSAIDEAINYLEKVQLTITEEEDIVENSSSVFEYMSKRKGDLLPVSAFKNLPDGRFESGTSKLEKRAISEIVPRWLKTNCIECNQCSLVCPHGVIRPYLLSEEEYNNAPEFIKDRCKEAIGKFDGKYYFIMGISIKDCTGCGLCIKTCPGKSTVKALISEQLDTELKNREQEVFDYLSSNIKDKGLVPKTTIKGTQFAEPKFMFHGACAGCGEPAYIKLLTQLFGDSLIIANATGCSSIYGGSTPSMPYTVPWANSLFEDNAEFGLGILNATKVIRERVARIMNENLDNSNKELFNRFLENPSDYEVTKEVYENLNYEDCPKELVGIKDYIPKKVVWAVGGDGWAYDIGYGGIDHVLASNENINILVLDTQIYSNTGGQASKASPKGSIASFASNGKMNSKKDLARMALAYPHVYVATVSMGSNMMQVIKALREAALHDGPSIVIAYCPCISHGIEGGMTNSLDMSKLATDCGYAPTFHYNPSEEKFYLDSKNVDFDLYEEFLNRQTRYSMLKKINPEQAEELLKQNKENAIKRFEYYKSLENKKEAE
ncbi:MAG: pyruvate:ferredoxin (flavodoxin) oxidoreductase [Firmicutes bacterium]|nr:pyruvate:ferredoxin (flavodoxin) oxidoreductase [Bacillota bacterium]